MKEYYQLATQHNLKKIREEKKITQDAIGYACGQNGSEISRYEQGKSMPGYWILLGIAKFLEAVANLIVGVLRGLLLV